MELYMLLLLSFLIIIISIWISKSSKAEEKLPGPTGLPIVGYLPFLTSRPYLKLLELSKKYGPLYKIRLGSVNFVMACDSKTITSALLNKNICYRPVDLFFNSKEDDISSTRAFLFDAWIDQRQICQQALGNYSSEKLIKDGVEELISRLQQTKNEPVFVRPYLSGSVSSVLFSWLLGKKISQDDDVHQNIAHLIERIGAVSPISWIICFPWIQTVLDALGLFHYIDPCIKLRKFISKEVDLQKETFDKNTIRSFLDSYFRKIVFNDQKNINPDLKEMIIKEFAVGFFIAGFQTTRSLIEWIFLILSEFPDVQKRIHNELDREFGREASPNYQDRYKTPYTEAVICEVFRWIPVFPIDSAKYSLTDITINGYVIPKNTRILNLHYGTFYDESLYGDEVDTFKPERFLSKDGQKLVKPKIFTPFSIGRRSCVGRSHGEVDIYLTIVAILQKFIIRPPPGRQVNLKRTFQVIHTARSQELCFEYRI